MLNKLRMVILGQLAKIIAGNKTDNKSWIFSSTDNIKFNYNSRFLFLHVINHYPKINAKFVINDDDERKRLTKKYGDYFCESKSLKGMINVCKAGVWFTSAGLPVYAAGLGKSHRIINLWHGVPLKKIVLSEENYSFFKKLYFKNIFSNNYSEVLTTSKTLVPIMAKSFGIEEKRVKVLGQPRNDALCQARIDKSNSGLLKTLLNDYKKETKYVLYAPTHRDGESVKLFPFKDWDKDKMERFLEKEDITILLRTHPEDKSFTKNYLSNRIKNFGADLIEDATEILPEISLLITDYSSIYIDYLILNKAMIFLPYDLNEYLSQRGMNFSYDEVTPGDKPATMQELFTSIKNGLTIDPYKKDRIKVNKIFNEIMVPCADDICQRVLFGGIN
ncbi:CDP-glycerol glycerophosphotransferase [Acetitomaculum ruminis DSM 5522]|uniref:CDP-glycerol glycerophosphotransferase n=1 Tax=Acetitomaculum ruminis DSM 5522 TaxID=1120918 RepID=A0A1I0W129_9FIRM|nr:CDP-glycerol glycerophosphotransferase family protein [Acetitomaculum ruminis]SFA82445.1 CDP-glycerol glycerophosphotransferase [Acetitomaculum ruminis DSM 5522]